MNNEIEKKMNGSANCEVEPFLKFIAQEWMSHIIAALARNESLRFGELRRALPGAISARVLSARLKELEVAGYVTRHDLSGRVLRVEYALSEHGRAIDALLSLNEARMSPASASPLPEGPSKLNEQG